MPSLDLLSCAPGINEQRDAAATGLPRLQETRRAGPGDRSLLAVLNATSTPLQVLSLPCPIPPPPAQVGTARHRIGTLLGHLTSSWQKPLKETLLPSFSRRRKQRLGKMSCPVEGLWAAPCSAQSGMWPSFSTSSTLPAFLLVSIG